MRERLDHLGKHVCLFHLALDTVGFRVARREDSDPFCATVARTLRDGREYGVSAAFAWIRAIEIRSPRVDAVAIVIQPQGLLSRAT